MTERAVERKKRFPPSHLHLSERRGQLFGQFGNLAGLKKKIPSDEFSVILSEDSVCEEK